MSRFSWRFIRVWQRNRDVFFRLWHAEIPGFIAEPVIVLLAMGIGLGAYVDLIDGGTYMEYVAPGIIAAYAMFSACFECTYGTYVRMEYQKTFDAIIATPLSINDVTIGEIFWGATRALMTGTIMLAVAAAFQLVHSPWALLIPVLAFLEGLLFSSIAVFYASVVPHINSFNYFFSLFITPMFLFSGVFFPLTAFPEIIQKLSWIAPLTPVVHLMRGAFNGDFYLYHVFALLLVAVLIGIFTALALMTMRKKLTT
jgi:lipooligosaccharide transport system permease protein